MKEIIRIGNGQGFWGDSIDAPVNLIKYGDIDYLTLDYLAEVTLSIMQRLKLKNADFGYASDFINLIDMSSEDLIKKLSNYGKKRHLKVGISFFSQNDSIKFSNFPFDFYKIPSAMNDNYLNEYELQDLTFGQGKGYLNAGLRWTIATNLLIELNLNDISKNTNTEYTNR